MKKYQTLRHHHLLYQTMRHHHLLYQTMRHHHLLYQTMRHHHLLYPALLAAERRKDLADVTVPTPKGKIWTVSWSHNRMALERTCSTSIGMTHLQPIPLLSLLVRLHPFLDYSLTQPILLSLPLLSILVRLHPFLDHSRRSQPILLQPR